MNKRLIALFCSTALSTALCACSVSDSSASESPAEVTTETVRIEENVDTPTSDDAAAMELTTEPAEAPTENNSVVVETVRSQIASGDFDSALATAQSAGLTDLTERLEALSAAAANCYVNVDPFNKNAIIYGNENILIGPNVNIIPFVNLSANLIRMQMGFRESFSDSDFSGVWATQVDLATATDHWAWPVDYDEFVTATDDDGITWVFETTLTDDAVAILTAVGTSAPGEVLMRFSDPAAGQKDVEVTPDQIAACAHIGAFVSAYQDVQALL